MDNLVGRHFKNEDAIKSLIVAGHRRGICDSSGRSIKKTNASGQRIVTARPRFGASSVVKTYVYRNGKMVLKE